MNMEIMDNRKLLCSLFFPQFVKAFIFCEIMVQVMDKLNNVQMMVLAVCTLFERTNNKDHQINLKIKTTGNIRVK